jgi:hypothetical protein
MTLFEFFGVLVAILGAMLCGAWGYQQFGWAGLAGGALIGLVIGRMAGVALSALMFLIMTWPERMQQRRDLRRFFGRYWSRKRLPEWQALETKLAVGDSVSGKVVASYYYGVYVDTGHGFPALLAVRYFGSGGEGPEPVVGDVLTGSVIELDASNRFIKLSQLAPGVKPAI